jgi:hypothetical protein
MRAGWAKPAWLAKVPRVARVPTLTSESRTSLGKLCTALFLATLATTTTGCPDGSYYLSKVYFANLTRKPVTVRVQALSAEVDCSALTGRATSALTRSAFTPFASYELGAGRALPLDLVTPGWEDNDSFEMCGAALVQVVGIPDQIVFWSGELGEVAIDTDLANIADPQFVRQSLRLEGTTGLERLVSGADLESASAAPLGTPTLVEEPPRPFGWSGARPIGYRIITRKEPLPDGCLSLELEAPFERTLSFFCGPAWGFPFELGDTVEFAGQNLVFEGTGDPPAKRVALSFGVDSESTSVRASRSAPAYVTACGAFVEPLDVAVAGVTLSTGQEHEQRTASGTTRYLLGRAERVLVAPPGCELERATLGARFDLLMLESPEAAP